MTEAAGHSPLEKKLKYSILSGMNQPLPKDGTLESLPPDAIDDPHQMQLAQLDMIAHLMDSAFTIPNTKISFGVDALIGLIPILGDTLSALISTFIISQARAMGVPQHKIWLMRFNIFMDWLIGCIPLIGDAFDLAWKANRRNIAIMRNHIEKQNTVIDQGDIL